MERLMSKNECREYCETHDTIAYYHGLDGLEIKGIEYAIEDYVIFSTGGLGGNKTYHYRMICYPDNEKVSPYFRFEGVNIPLDECIKTGFWR